MKYEGASLPDYYEPDNLQKYRNRDLYWYENRYDSRNRLSDSFSKYNFFDTDSAARLSSDEDAQKGLVEAFISLALGDKVNHLEERLIKFHKTLKSEQNRLDKSANEFVARENGILSLIQSLQRNFGKLGI